jgi:hypothetical protein
MQTASLYADSQEEVRRYMWIESEKAGSDLGEAAIRQWILQHWRGYLQVRWLEHLEGKRFWIDLDCGDFGLLQPKYPDNLLLDRIIDRLKAGQENLDIILGAIDWGSPTESPVVAVYPNGDYARLGIGLRRLSAAAEGEGEKAAG